MAADAQPSTAHFPSHSGDATLPGQSKHVGNLALSYEKAGFSGNDISIVGKLGLPGDASTLRRPGLWQKLFGRDIEEHEARVYGKTVEPGGVVLTTQKDLVKLRRTHLGGRPLWAVRVRLDVVTGQEALERRLLPLTARATPRPDAPAPVWRSGRERRPERAVVVCRERVDGRRRGRSQGLEPAAGGREPPPERRARPVRRC